jgi:hypothetical protein
MSEVHRELGEIEYFNWCFGQPNNIAVAVRIRGGVRPDALREALAKAQQRHPLMRVNTERDARGTPWFSSESVGAIPLTVVDGAGPDDARVLLERELATPFAMDAPGPQRLPLVRVTLLLPRDAACSADVVIAMHHVVTDGLSMVFLVRDLLRFMEQPDAPVVVLDAPASADDLLPLEVRRRIPTTDRRFRIALRLAKIYARLPLARPELPRAPHAHLRTEHALSVEQTARLRARCKAEGVSVHSAICAAFVPAFTAVHTPVNLRALLARPVGESVGIYTGGATVKTTYRTGDDFWANARCFHRRLRRAMRDPFSIYRLFSKAVPIALVRELGPIMVQMTAHGRPFGVTNLGDLDRDPFRIHTGALAIESFFGASTPIIESSILTVYTIDGSLRLHAVAVDAATRDDIERGIAKLVTSI